MAGLPETKYMRIFPIQEIDQTRRLQRDRSLVLAVQPYKTKGGREVEGKRGWLTLPCTPAG